MGTTSIVGKFIIRIGLKRILTRKTKFSGKKLLIIATITSTIFTGSLNAVAQYNYQAGRAEYPVKPEEKDNSTADDILECPVEQKQVENGAKPDVELFKKIIRCKKGEKEAEKGYDGAVKVEVTAIKVGESRPWSYKQDIGNGKSSTIVYPVKATYTVKTLYRTATEVEEGWIRILNFYVNSFGEWQIGSEEPVKSPKVSRVEK